MSSFETNKIRSELNLIKGELDKKYLTEEDEAFLKSETNQTERNRRIFSIIKREFVTPGLIDVFLKDAEKKIRKMVVNKWTQHTFKGEFGEETVDIFECDMALAMEIAGFDKDSKGKQNLISMKWDEILMTLITMLMSLPISDYEKLYLKFWLRDPVVANEQMEDLNKDSNRFRGLLEAKDYVQQCICMIKCIFKVTEKDEKYQASEDKKILLILRSNLESYQRLFEASATDEACDLELTIRTYDPVKGIVGSRELNWLKNREDEQYMHGFYRNPNRGFVRVGKDMKKWIYLTVLVILLSGVACENSIDLVMNDWGSVEYRHNYRDRFYTSKSDLYRDQSLSVFLSKGNGIENITFGHMNYTFQNCLGMRVVSKIIDTENGMINIERGCENSDYCLSSDCKTCGDVNCQKLIRSFDDILCNTVEENQIRRLNGKGLSKFGRGKLRMDPFFNDFEICSVDGKRIRPCKNEVKAWGFFYRSLNWDGQLNYYLDIGMSAWYDVEVQSSYACKDQNTGLQCNEIQNNGDDIYCSYFSCATWSSCYCSPNMTSGIITLQSTQEVDKFVPKCVTYSFGLLGLEDSDVIMKENLNYLSEDKRDLIAPSYKIDGCNLIFSFLGRTLTFYVIKASPEESMALVNRTDTFTFTLSKSQCINDKFIQVDLLFGEMENQNDREWTEDIYFKAPDTCALIDCYWCYDYWFFMNCWKAYYWIINVAMVVIAIILMAQLFKSIYIISKIMYMISCLIRWFIKSIYEMSKWFMDKIKIKKNQVKEATEMRETVSNNEELMEVVTNRPEKKTKNSGTAGARLSWLMTILLLFLVCDNGIECCSQFSQMVGNTGSCTVDANGVTKCTYGQTLDFTIAPYGQESCVVFKDNNQKPLGTLKFMTTDVRMRCNYALNYYVPEPEIKCESVHNCDGNGLCTGDKCAGVTQSNYDTLFPAATTHKGWGQCFGVCGCAGCGCFLCGGACLLGYKYFTNPSAKWYEVGTCNSWEYVINVDYYIEYINKYGNTTTTPIKTAVLSPTQTIAIDMLGTTSTVKLSSVSVPPIPLLDNCIIRDPVSDSTAMADCNKVSEFSSGKIGEIQCPDPNAAQNTKTSCTALESLITMSSSGSHSVGCIGTVLSPTKVFNDNKLPKSSAGVTIQERGNQIEASVRQIALYGARMFTIGFTLESLIEDNKCSVSFKELTGCYKCFSGAELKFSGYTDFGTSSVHIECPTSGIDTWLSLNSTAQDFNIIVNSKTQNVDETCNVYCNTMKTTMKIKGNLITVTNPDEEVDQESNSQSLLVKLSKTWWGWLAMIGVGGAAIIIVIGIILGLCWFCRSTTVKIKSV